MPFIEIFFITENAEAAENGRKNGSARDEAS
jgi:hypothetical protein